MARLGVDVGSRNVKFALQAPGNGLRLWELPTPQFYREHIRVLPNGEIELDFSGLELPPLEQVAATGYGRNNVKFSGARVVSEIMAHAQGALPGQPDQFCLLDLGGQDTKVVLVKSGQVEDFSVNDKCAAGSGRYLENMAQVLGVELNELFRHHLDPVDLSTTCAVYAESEIIGKIADGISVPRLCAGVNHSTYLRLRPMLERWPERQLVFVGGGAKNRALVHYLEEAGFAVTVPEHPEYNGALGCLALLNEEK